MATHICADSAPAGGSPSVVSMAKDHHGEPTGSALPGLRHLDTCSPARTSVGRPAGVLTATQPSVARRDHAPHLTCRSAFAAQIEARETSLERT